MPQAHVGNRRLQPPPSLLRAKAFVYLPPRKRKVGFPLFYSRQAKVNHAADFDSTTWGQWAHEQLAELAPDVFVVDARVLKGRLRRLELRLDTDTGIGIDQLARLHRQLRARLVERMGEDAVPDLELMSPGAEQPLLLPRQYARHVGRSLSIRTTDGRDLKARLLAASATHLELETTGPDPENPKKKIALRISLPLAQVAKANVVVSLSAHP